MPQLPVPSLADSIQQILAALKPLLTTEEYDQLLEESSRCLSDKSILLIQKHLEAAAKDPSVTCYLNSINGDSYPGIYGEIRGGILPRNPYLVLEEDPYAMTINPPNQAQRAASLVNSSLKFIVTMRNGTLKPDVAPRSGKPLTMNCYQNLFGTTRVPEKHHTVTIQKSGNGNDSRHVVFICNNRYYSLEVLTEMKAEPHILPKTPHLIWFNDADLAAKVQAIIVDANSVDRTKSVTSGIGSITTQTYTQWTSARHELARSSPDLAQTIDNALFVVVLDDTVSPVSDQDKITAISHGLSMLAPGTNIQVGSCTSRWYDKLQIIITKNATAGVVWEPSTMDSTAILRFISDIYTDLILKLAKNINGAESTLFDSTIQFVLGLESEKKPRVRPLHFNMTPEIVNLVHLSETRLADLLNQHELKTLTMKLNTHLLSKLGISTDSFLQVGFQIAYYALYGKMANTLEPITTRKFRDARTELIAVQSDEISHLVKLFISCNEASKKWDCFKRSCAAHTAQCRAAMAGKGFERHMNAISQVLSRPQAAENLNRVNSGSGLEPIGDLASLHEQAIPLLTSNLLEKLMNAEILISNCGNPALRLFGISPAIDQGFGVGYIIHKDKVVVTVSSKYRQTQRLLDTFESVMAGVKEIVASEADMVMAAADTQNRKDELKHLRLKKELSKVNLDLSLTRHPIDLAFAAAPEAEVDLETVPQDNKDYSYLGGYGYFDEGQVALRSDELIRAESLLNSLLHLPSVRASRDVSRHHSSTNLAKMGNELRERLSLSDRIRDRLSPSLNESSEEIAEVSYESKSSIGRSIKHKF